MPDPINFDIGGYEHLLPKNNYNNQFIPYHEGKRK